MAVRVAILSNCQHESLAIALRACLPDADIVSFELNSVLHDDAGREAIAVTLGACDHVISQDIAPGYGPLSTRALRAAVRHFHLLPAMHFGGFHPDAVSVRLDHVPIIGPAGGLHSRIVVTGFLTGMSPDETTELFNALVFARLGYFDALGEHSALLIEKFAAYGMDLSNVVPIWRNGGCFMHSTHHPKMVVFIDLARMACAMMGLTPQAVPVIATLRDPLAAFSTMPFLPEIAARCGMQPEGVFRNTLPAPPLSLDAFVRGSFQAFARVPLRCLRAVQGVPEALARLGLAAAPPPKRASVGGPDHQGLLSWHGTIVRIESASSLIVHEPLWPPSADCDDLILRMITGPDGVTRAGILGGLDLAPGLVTGTVSLSRQGRSMVAEAALLAVPFKGDGSGHDAAFLPLDLDDISHLRVILSQSWMWQGTPRRAAAAAIRLRPGFMLDFGIFAITLTDGLPEPVPAGEEGGPGYRLQSAIGPITIRPIVEPGRKREIALVADPGRRMPDDAGSIPEFRTAPQVSWSLASPDEILHPPLTAHDRDTVWVHERCAWPGGLPSGLQQRQATLRRMADRVVLLSPGVEGILFDTRGAMGDYPVISFARGQALPPGLRQEEGVLLVEAEQVSAAPILNDPALICLSPGGLGNDWRSTDGWLIDIALRLHVMAPFLPPRARLLVPPGFAEVAPGHLAMLSALGLGEIPVLEAPASLCRLADAVWLDSTTLFSTPGAVLRSFRARIAALFPATTGTPTRLYIKRSSTRRIAANDIFDSFLATQGFTTIVPDELSPASRIAHFRGAEMVIGAHGEGLADIVFCQAGTRVLEISPRGQFRPRYWMLAEKCGLIYGVLPCATEGGGFDSTLQLDVGKLRNLFRVLRLSTDK